MRIEGKDAALLCLSSLAMLRMMDRFVWLTLEMKRLLSSSALIRTIAVHAAAHHNI